MSRRSRPTTAAVPARADDAAPAARWTHGQEIDPPVAPRMPSCVASGVWLLRHADPPAIGDAEVVAADRFRVDYIRGVEGVREPSLAQRSGSADHHDVQIMRAEAVTRHREISEVIGPRMTDWLVDFLVLDLSFVAMADRHWPGDAGRKEMRGAMATMLLLLSRLYAAIDRRKPKPGDGGLRAVAVAVLTEPEGAAD